MFRRIPLALVLASVDAVSTAAELHQSTATSMRAKPSAPTATTMRTKSVVGDSQSEGVPQSSTSGGLVRRKGGRGLIGAVEPIRRTAAKRAVVVSGPGEVEMLRDSTRGKGTTMRSVGAVSSQNAACSVADSDMHLVFSTGCNAFQNWQAEVLLNSAYRVGQCGKMTRIVVGCDADQTVQESDASTHPDSLSATRLIGSRDLTKSSFPNLRVHHAPAIEEAKKFPWFNKPWSFHHWLQHRNESEPLERVIAILDPDEFFFQPLTQRGGVLEKDKDARAEHPEAFPLLHAPGKAQTDVVQPGMAVAQQYGLGTRFLDLFDQKKICPGGEESPCAHLSREDAFEYYPAGPPYLLHRDDFKKVAPLWWDLMKPVYAKDKGDIQADMYAYIYAAVHHNVKHALFTQYMVSNVDDEEEGWKWIDDLDSMSCHNPKFPEGHPRPGFLHAASHFKACTGGDKTEYDMTQCQTPDSELWNFHKGHVPGEVLNCEHPVLMQPPDDFFNVQVESKNSRAKRDAFMVCNLISMVNHATLEYKQKFCQPGYNAKKCTRLVLETEGKHAFNATNPWSYPLAMVDGDCCPECGELANSQNPM